MALEDLVAQIKNDTEKKIEEARKDGNAKIEELNNSFREKMGSLRELLEAEIAKEKERILNDYTRERDFESRKRILSLKGGILQRFAEKAFDATSEEDRKSFYRKEIERARNFLGEKFKIYVSSKERSVVLSVLEILGMAGQVEIVDNNEIGDGFFLEADKILLSVSLRDAIKELIDQEKGRFSSLLFG